MNVLRIATCCLFTTITVGVPLKADDASSGSNHGIRVQLRDGRWISGDLDPGTTQDHLWLQTAEPGIVARSGFRWASVQQVVQNGERLAPDAFRNLITPASFEPLPAVEATSTPCLTCDDRPVSIEDPPLAVVRSVDIRAFLANWDSDVEPDGLLVEVLPRDGDGLLAAVNGQISFTLIGENTPNDPQDLFQPRARYPEMTRSSERVRETDFAGGPAIYKVPFRTAHPDFRFDLAAHAVLTATLGVPGQGTFHASDDTIHFRPGNWIRDRRQQFFGKRYFPQEATIYRK